MYNYSITKKIYTMYKILLMGLAFAAINLIPMAAQVATEFLIKFTQPAPATTRKTRQERQAEEAEAEAEAEEVLNENSEAQQ